MGILLLQGHHLQQGSQKQCLASGPQPKRTPVVSQPSACHPSQARHSIADGRCGCRLVATVPQDVLDQAQQVVTAVERAGPSAPATAPDEGDSQQVQQLKRLLAK